MEEKKLNLAIYILAALVILLGVVLIVRIPTLRIAGMAETAIGTATITVQTQTAIVLDDSTVAFNVGQGGANDSDTAGDWFGIQNSGNTKINVDANVTGETFTQAVVLECNCKSGSNDSGICETSYTDCTGTAVDLLWCLDFTDGSNSFDSGINVSVSNDESPGAKDVNITFYAEQNASC